ncbi:RsmF rRNA methyltransferase first C-terminal domain-containing protein [Paenibacillus sp.]|uniref:RsmF rRNA methyltransferase first C-terminal domain-containing protein n=1 Tax=Paenibacillus sp. TaxID=58172 RepID=UPI002D4E7C93|nr:RsmF rRNA methyltransferase first C-terminal domain-containing protein [Paenibacillus sp.]HZG54882.1 RsmF rRNA methyltransferase first C-terminal domain-containing protein [Paenibacillus sp.]
MTTTAQLPKAFLEKMQRLLGPEAEAWFASYDAPRAIGLRANPLKLDASALARKLPFGVAPVPWCETGFAVVDEPGASAPGKHPYHAAGLYYMQEPSAMYPAAQLGVQPGERVLDLCAAPGGKTTHIGGALAGRGLLIANEYEAKRAKALSENVERLGLANCLVLNETPERLAARFPGYFDRILVDAPCSGEGMFRKDPEAAAYWSESHVEACARLQTELLDAAVAMLRGGGTLVYSTCTFSPEENERAIEALLARHPALELEPLPLVGGVSPGVPAWTAGGNERLAGAARLWPHRVRGEGHFAAKLRKADGGNAPVDAAGGDGAAAPAGKRRPSGGSPAPTRQQLALYRAFEAETIVGQVDGTFAAYGPQLYRLPEDCPDLTGLRAVRPGLHLGELKKDRFEPNHALALALPADRFRHKYELLDGGERAADAYFRGETLASGEDRGWLVVTYDGFPVGWGKESKGTLKNFYPKGLRRMGV